MSKIKMADYSWAISYKQLQAHFVSNLNGTSLLEISLVVSTAPLAVLLRSCLGALFWGSLACCSFSSAGFVFILDYTTLILPVLLAFTWLSNYTIIVLITMTILIITSIISICFITEESTENTSHHQTKRQPFICNFRAYVLIATAISILAVDFNIFPRRFAKAETFGSGLMDVGVGAFVVSNAIVSPEARADGKVRGSWTSATVKAIRSSVPLLVLGLARFLAVKSTDYQEHVSEYGMHWNFFLTLFVVKVLSTMLVHLPLLNKPWTYGLTGIAIATVYQVCLTQYGLEDYIINGSSRDGMRHGLMDANREGLFSCFGYLALYFIGLQLGRFLLTKRDSIDSMFGAFFILLFLDIVFWLSTVICCYYVTPVSRRLANITFVLWQMAYNIQLLASFLLADIIVMTTLPTHAKPAGCEVCYTDTNSLTREPIRSRHCACLIASINRNQLAYFLLANLLTGVVNFSVKTLFCTPSESLWIMNSYMFVLNLVFVLLHCFGVSLKV